MFKIQGVNRKIYTVYGVHLCPNNGTLFLIFRDEKWTWVVSRGYIPYEEMILDSPNDVIIND